MCHFITASIGLKKHLSSLNHIGEKFGLKFNQIRNDYVESQLPGGLTYLSKHSMHCDCGTVLGSLSNDSELDIKVSEKEIKKLRKKGWTETKIRRWVAEREKYKNKLQRETAIHSQRWAPEANEWLEFIKSVVLKSEIGTFGLLLHFYNSSPESEKVKLSNVVKIPVKNIDFSFLLKIEEDVYYQFIK